MDTITNKEFFTAMTAGHVVSEVEAAKAAHLLDVLNNRKPSKRAYKNKHAEEYNELAVSLPVNVELAAVDFVEAGIYDNVRAAAGFLTWAANNGIVSITTDNGKGKAKGYTLLAAWDNQK